jgi:multimeric flavodoxin WrbA
MKIAILNGNPEASSFDAYLAQLKLAAEAAGHVVTQIDLRDIPLRYCVGCFGCWVKTPGQCVARDASLEMDRAVINADFVLWAAPLKMGFPSALLKMAMDKHLPLIHPYMEVDQGEAHHRRRYPRSPRVGLLVEKEPGTDEHDLQIVTDIICRSALNLKTRLAFSLTAESTPDSVTRQIVSGSARSLPLPGRLAPTVGTAINPPARLTLFNGSPRGRRGNTPIMLGELAKGFGGEHAIYHLNRVKETAQFVDAFTHAECVWLGFPLYVDAMPGIVKHFIEALQPLAERKDNPPIGFLVQSGFPEALHSRYIERYLERLASRLGSPYLGTIVKGGGEGIRAMPPEANRQLFERLQASGRALALNGRLDPDIVCQIATPERFPAVLGPVFRMILRLPGIHAYFDDMLKKNGVYQQRFAQPFAEQI